MSPDASGIHDTLILISVITNLFLAAGGAFMYYRWNRQRGVSEQLLQEKEVIFGFVHDVGEVFVESDEIELEALLKRVLYYALRTTRASAGSSTRCASAGCTRARRSRSSPTTASSSGSTGDSGTAARTFTTRSCTCR